MPCLRGEVLRHRMKFSCAETSRMPTRFSISMEIGPSADQPQKSARQILPLLLRAGSGRSGL